MSDNIKYLVKSTPFRLGVLFTLFYLFCFSIGGALFFKNMQARVNSQIDSMLTQRFSNITESFQDHGIDRVVRRLGATESVNPLQFGLGYQIVDEKGEVVFGKLTGFQQSQGFHTMTSEELGLAQSKVKFRLYSDNLGDHRVTLGVNVNLRDDLQRKFISSFAITFILTSIIALLGALYFARKYNQRFTFLTQFMERVDSNNLERRLPVSGRGDGLDSLSGDINSALSLLQRQVTGMKQVSENIAHDLKTPLSRLSIKIEEALSATSPDDPVYKKLEAASDNAFEINSTFEKLLNIAQLEAGARKSKFVDTDLVALLHKVFEVFQVMAEESNQRLVANINDNQLLMLGDDDLLCQLVVNLLENAIHHCPPGSEILLSGGSQDGCPWLSVCDDGEGIPQSEMPLVYDPLYRLEKSRTSKGSGLGLTLVKAIADLHGGEIILLDNKPGLCVKIVFEDRCTASGTRLSALTVT